jgi:pimeloyl-ACP methyl ester carboxylesterase
LKTFGGPPGPTPGSTILPRLECPVLALWGGADPWLPVGSGMHPGTEFHKFASKDFELVVLDGVGHCPHDEAPDEVHSIILPWMDETVIGRSRLKQS